MSLSQTGFFMNVLVFFICRVMYVISNFYEKKHEMRQDIMILVNQAMKNRFVENHSEQK